MAPAPAPNPPAKIENALVSAKTAYRAAAEAPWHAPFYQHANRLAHLHYLRGLNGLDAYLVFIYFADAPDVPTACSAEQVAGCNRDRRKEPRSAM